MLEIDIAVRRRALLVEAALSLAPGERLSVFGTSGAGKTTLLEAIAGTARLEHGEVRIDGVDVSALPLRHRRVGVVRQPTTLFPHLSVAANVSYGVSASEGAAVDAALERVGLRGLGRAVPGALSGGQRQRAAFARAIARPFRVLLLDEPFSAVDVGSRVDLMELAERVTGEQEAATLFVTHDLSEAQGFGQRIAILDSGRILQLGDPEKVVAEPATVRVAELCGYDSFVDHDDDQVWALHADRFLLGAHPDRGLVFSGQVTSVRAAGVRFRCEMAAVSSERRDRTTGLRMHLDSPPEVGADCVVTAIRPPLVTRVT
jgi:ABC-type sulfate/molybdate transport systems ATPase subunit